MRGQPAAVLLLLTASLLTGCTATGRMSSSSRLPASYTIFNPDWNRLPLVSVPRADWPVTTAFSKLGESIEYRETIIDWQGRFAGARDQRYYRRFESVRTGRARR